MENVFKNFIYTGVGFVSLTAERFKKVVEDLIKDDKISKDEGKKILDDFLKNSETKREELEGQFNSIVEKLVRSFNFATSKDVEKLNERLENLEAVLAQKEDENEPEQEKEEAKTAAKKTTRTRKTTTKKDEEE